MKLNYDIPASFWGLFRSVNRDIYIEALLTINDEYQYNNYFLSREACIQILADMCAARRYAFEREEDETEEETKEALPRRILNWLIGKKWLRKIEDYTTMTTNIVIPDYAGILIDAFDRLANEPLEDTDIYIQNVYATLFSFQNDRHMNLAMLKTALVNTKRLNKALQDMLHNMDKFFERLLEQESYGELLKEHLYGYVEEVVKRKYHILKTSDNFYIYKTDIKRCLREMREDEEWVETIRKRQQEARRETGSAPAYMRRNRDADVLDYIDQIERGFDDIEHRIANMDREHSKYVRATVSRLNYLLSDETERHGLLIQLLNALGSAHGSALDKGEEDDRTQKERLAAVAERMNLTSFTVLNESPLFKRRRRKRFGENLVEDTAEEELSRDDVLRLNKLKHRFTKKQIEDFIEIHMEDGAFETDRMVFADADDFEKLILAYDISIRKGGRYAVAVRDGQIERGGYSYPSMLFTRRADREEEER